MSPHCLKKFEKLAWITRLYFGFNPFEVRIPRANYHPAEGGEKKDLVFYFSFQLAQVEAEPPRMGLIEDRNEENPDERMILKEETADHVAFIIPSIIKAYPPTFLGASVNPWALPGLSYMAADNLKHFLENIDGITVTDEVRSRIFESFGRVFERLAMLYELVEVAAADNMDGLVRALNRAAKDFSTGLSVGRVGFPHLKFIHSLEDGSLLHEYKFFGLAPGGLQEMEMTQADLDRLSGQGSGLGLLEVVRDDPEGGKVELTVITGWKDKFPVVMMPQGEILPAWASQPITGINSALFYPEGAFAIRFTEEEVHYFETLETAAKLSQRNPRATAFPVQSFNYVLAVSLGEQWVEAWLVSNENDKLDKSHVRLRWPEGMAGTLENAAQQALWAARLALYRARNRDDGVVRPKEILKLGVAGNPSFMESAVMLKMPQMLKEALADNKPPKAMRAESEELAQSIAV